MLKYQEFEVNDQKYVKAYSDTGMYIRSNGVLYNEVFFEKEKNLKFVQTRIPIGSFEKNLKGEKHWVNLRD